MPIRTAVCILLAVVPMAGPLAQSNSRFRAADTSQVQVKQGIRWLESNFASQVDEWIRITEIPGTSRHEQARAAYLAAEMRAAGLTVRLDSIGNVIGVRRGTGGGPAIVFAGHMDTVHPLETDVRVRRAGDTLRAPGVFDNSASLANMLAVIRALNVTQIRTRGDLVFVATVQEELGLAGMGYWLDRNPGAADMLVALDGGLGPIYYGALGIYWTRYSFRAQGSHTVFSAGKPHPVRALADAVRAIYELQIPVNAGHTVFNVGMIDGGKIFNAIPEEASFTVDLRSVDPRLLDSLDAEITRTVEKAASTHRVTWQREVVVRNGAGGTEETLRSRRNHPLVETAHALQQHFNVQGMPQPTGSTDANQGVVRGIPSISIGRSAGGDQHTLSEWAHIPSALVATKMLWLLAISMAEIAG